MALYVTYCQFTEIYGEEILTEWDFDRIAFEAQRVLDTMTSGVDGVRKLAVAMPTDDYAAECVRRCLCKLIMQTYQVTQARTAAAPVTRPDGTITATGAVTAISSGAESVTFASGSALPSAVTTAAGDRGKEMELYAATIREYLSGVTDANGVGLLYGGRYPVRLGG